MRKLILFCVMLITGLTHAQTFDFSCAEGSATFTFETQIGIGIDAVVVATASKTITTSDPFTLTINIPNGYAITKAKIAGQYAQSSQSGFTYMLGELVVDADSFDVVVTPPSTLNGDALAKSSLEGYIGVLNTNYVFEIQIGSGDNIATMTASQTIIGGQVPDSFELQYTIPYSYAASKKLSNDYTQTFNNGFIVTIESFELEPDGVNVIVTPPSVIDFSTNHKNTQNLGSFITYVTPPAMFTTTINGVEQEPLEDGGYEEYVIIDGSESYQGSIEVTIDGDKYIMEHPGDAWSKQIGDTRFFVVIYGPTAPAGSEWKLNSWRIAHQPVGNEDTTHTVTWKKAVDGIAGIDFVIDTFSIDAVKATPTDIVIGWNIAGETSVLYQKVTPDSNYNSYKLSIDLPDGITTQDIGDWTIWDGDYDFGIKMQESADGDENLEYLLVLGSTYFNDLPTDASINPNLTFGLNTEYFNGIPDASLPIIGDGVFSQSLNGVVVANLNIGESTDIISIASGENAYITIPGIFTQVFAVDGEGNYLIDPDTQKGYLVDSDELKKFTVDSEDQIFDFGTLSTSGEEYLIYFQFTAVSASNNFIFTVY